MSGRTEDFRFKQTHLGLGPVRVDTTDYTLTTDVEAEPPGCLYLIRVVAGEMVLYCEGAEHRVRPGGMVLATHPRRGYRTVLRSAKLQVIGIDVPLLQDVSGVDEPAERLLAKLNYGPLTASAAASVQRAVGYLTDTFGGGAPPTAGPQVLEQALNLLAAVVLEATNGTAQTVADRTAARPATLTRATDYIEGNVETALTVSDIARAAFVTPRALQLAFRRHLDTTPLAYARRLRLQQAHEQLRDAQPGGTVTVTSVAARWGMTSSRFTALYRQTYGELPSHTLRY